MARGVQFALEQRSVLGRRRSGKNRVDPAAIGIYDGRDVIRRLHAPLDFERNHARRHDLVEKRQAVQVERTEYRGAALVFFNGEELAGALFFHQMIRPAARLRASAAICAAAGQIRAEHTAAGIAHAHRAVNERFQFEFARRFCAQLGDFLERHFARQHHARRAHIGINARGGEIQAVRLRAYVNGKVRRGFANGGNRAEVGDDHRVGSEGFERLRVIRQRVNIAVVGECVDRDIYAAAHGMRFANRLREVFHRKTDLTGAQLHLRAAEIDRVRAETQRRAHALEVAGGGEKFKIRHGQFLSGRICALKNGKLRETSLPA